MKIFCDDRQILKQDELDLCLTAQALIEPTVNSQGANNTGYSARGRYGSGMKLEAAVFSLALEYKKHLRWFLEITGKSQGDKRKKNEKPAGNGFDFYGWRHQCLYPLDCKTIGSYKNDLGESEEAMFIPDYHTYKYSLYSILVGGRPADDANDCEVGLGGCVQLYDSKGGGNGAQFVIEKSFKVTRRDEKGQLVTYERDGKKIEAVNYFLPRGFLKGSVREFVKSLDGGWPEIYLTVRSEWHDEVMAKMPKHFLPLVKNIEKVFLKDSSKIIKSAKKFGGNHGEEKGRTENAGSGIDSGAGTSGGVSRSPYKD